MSRSGISSPGEFLSDFSMSCFISKIFAIKSSNRRETTKVDGVYVFLPRDAMLARY